MLTTTYLPCIHTFAIYGARGWWNNFPDLEFEYSAPFCVAAQPVAHVAPHHFLQNYFLSS